MTSDSLGGFFILTLALVLGLKVRNIVDCKLTNNEQYSPVWDHSTSHHTKPMNFLACSPEGNR